MQPSCARRHLFKCPARSYPRVREGMTMKLGPLSGDSGAYLEVPVDLAQHAEELGYDSVWSAEAYGSDAVTPLAFLAGKTSSIKLGTGIMQLAGPRAEARWPRRPGIATTTDK